jgi:hypothetical protein
LRSSSLDLRAVKAVGVQLILRPHIGFGVEGDGRRAAAWGLSLCSQALNDSLRSTERTGGKSQEGCS